jgi:PAS domain S-box-containing protein
MNVKALHILLVEDSETHAAIICESLDSCTKPLKVTVARSLSEARICMREFVPDLAIIDCFLPDGRGIELLPGGQEEPAYPSIIMTSHGDEAVAVEAMKAGALDYVPKSPTALAHMHRIIERVLREWGHIVKRKRAEQELQAVNHQLQNIIEFLPDATFVVDRKQRVIAWNRGMEEMTGVPKKAILGRGNEAYSYAFYGTHRPLLIDLLGNPDPKVEATYDVFERRKEIIFAECFVPKLYNGKGAYLWGKASLLLDRIGNQVGAIESLRDTTVRRQAEEGLKQANQEMDTFVYTVSHDLRTPLTAVIGYAEFLRENYRDQLDELALSCLDQINISGDRMMVMMEDLLTLAKVRQIEVPPDDFDPEEVLNEVISGFSGRPFQVGVTFKIDKLPPLRVPKTLLSQVLDNLIGNALKYGCSPGDVIEVGGERKGERVRFYVRDHGPGIPFEERSRIFEPFHRGPTEKEVQGTGIGLATVQKIAKLFDGRAWVEDTPGGGSTFWVEVVDFQPNISTTLLGNHF